MGFLMADGGHKANITRIKNIPEVPMFISLSGAGIVGNIKSVTRIVRWESTYPPRKLAVYEEKGVIDCEATWIGNRLYLASMDHSLLSIDLRKNKKIKRVPKAHTDKVTGLALIPYVNFVISGGGFKVKIWNSNLELMETLFDSKTSISGRLIYKESDKIIGAVNLGGIIFWKHCDIPHCHICYNSKICHKCGAGYFNNKKGQCIEGGSPTLPIKWHLKNKNIDRTLYRIQFDNVDRWENLQIRRNVNPNKFVTIFLDDIDESKNHFKMKFTNATDGFGWDFEIDYGVGLGLRNLSVVIQNKTLNVTGKHPHGSSSSSSSGSKSSSKSKSSSNSKSSSKSSGSKKLRMLASSGSSSKKSSGSSSNSKYHYPKAPKLSPTKKRTEYFFIRGPKSLPIPSMPAFSTKFIMIPLHSILGTVWRIFYWLSYLLIFCFDLWSVRWKDWGVIRQNRSTKKKLHR
jgi:hypothetical protein